MTSSRLEGVARPGTIVRAFAWVAGRVSGTNPPNLFLKLGRHRRLFWAWIHFASALMPRGRLPRRVTEIAILRGASLSGCGYELEHHRRLAARWGLAEAEITGAEHGLATQSFSPLELVVIRAVDQLHEKCDLDDETFATLEGLLSAKQIVELVMLVGHYSMLATTIRALRIEPDRAGA